MLGLMQEQPLLISSIIRHAARHHAAAEVVSKTVEGAIHRTTYAEIERRAQHLAGALHGLGIGVGDRVATLAWNGHRHLELYYAVSGIGAVCHTIRSAASSSIQLSARGCWIAWFCPIGRPKTRRSAA